MDLVIKNINSKTDIKFFNELAKRLGLKTAELSIEEKEDIAIGKAIEEGLKSGFAEEASVLKTLRKIQGKK